MKTCLGIACLLWIAQDSCPDLGAAWNAGRLESGPPLACGPAWHLWTPPHCAPVPRAGYTRRVCREVPRLLVRYACTGSVLMPLRIVEAKTLGTVLDAREERCR